jgi:hypothetical protein
MIHRASQYLAWLAIVLAFSCKSAVASAEPSLRVTLAYTADPTLECPSGAELTSSIARQLGYDPFTSEPSAPQLRVVITKLVDGAEAQIEWIDQHQQSEGERRLASGGSGCTELARSLPFALAVQIQLHAASAGAQVTPAPPEIKAPPDTPPKPPSARPVLRAKPPRLILVGVGALARHGLTPGVSPGLRLLGVLSRKSWSFELSVHATWPAELRRPDATGFTARELGANLVPCLRWDPVGLCAVGTLSVLHVRGQGVDHIGSPSSIGGGVGGRLQLFWPALERVGIVVQGEALAVLSPRDVLLNRTTVWSTAPVAFTAILDFTAIFR